MTQEELKKQIAEIELEAKKKIEELCNKATEEIEKSSRVWEPKKGDAVWCWIYCTEQPCCNTYCGEGYLRNYYEAEEFFPTKEACAEAHKAKVIQTKWKRLATESGEEDNPWDDYCEHWFVRYNRSASKIVCGAHIGYVSESVYFASEEAIKAAVAEIGEENVKKYILGIKEE